MVVRGWCRDGKAGGGWWVEGGGSARPPLNMLSTLLLNVFASPVVRVVGDE
jgi:hypothetical protein